METCRKNHPTQELVLVDFGLCCPATDVERRTIALPSVGAPPEEGQWEHRFAVGSANQEGKETLPHTRMVEAYVRVGQNLEPISPIG